MLVLYAFKANLRALGVEGIGLSVIKPKVTDIVPCCHAVITLALGPRSFTTSFVLACRYLERFYVASTASDRCFFPGRLFALYHHILVIYCKIE